MTMKVRRVAVLGAGVMGAQIAALLAAAGVKTHLLDLPSEKAPEDPKLAKELGDRFRSQRAIMALKQLSHIKPSPLLGPDVLFNLFPGNFTDDMKVLADCDWVIEAVVERLDIKQIIHKAIAEHVKPHVPVTTNTSGISLASILEGLPKDYGKRFFGTHFFNPPRYMHLLEVIPHDGVDDSMVKELSLWIEEHLGKGIVVAKDTVNFIANRIGVFNMQIAEIHRQELGLNIETADALTGSLVGRPSSATYRTVDVVGIDTYIHVSKNVLDLAHNDPFRQTFTPAPWLLELVKKGALGSKSNDTGCYKKSTDKSGKRDILVYRPEKGQYESQAPETFPWLAQISAEKSLLKRVGLILDYHEHNPQDKGAAFVWRVLRDTFNYCAHMVQDIAFGDVKSLDEAIRFGFNWDLGPFEFWQGLGFHKVKARMEKDHIKLPNYIHENLSFYEPAPLSAEYTLNGYKSAFNATKQKHISVERKPYHWFLPQAAGSNDKRIIVENSAASLLDFGDGILGLVFHTKMNAVDDQMLALTEEAVQLVGKKYDGLVIANEGRAFSAGANLKGILAMAKAGDFEGIDRMLLQFQRTMELLKFAPFPVVAAPHQMILGGGCEYTLHCRYRVVTNETYAGLVEIGVGLLPAAGGTKELALRAYDLASRGENVDPMPFLQRAFQLIGLGKVSTCGQETVSMGLYPAEGTEVSLSRQHQILRAKHLAKAHAHGGYRPLIPKFNIKVVGDAGVQTFKMFLYNMLQARQLSAYDAEIATKIATVLCGGEIDSGTEVTESHFLHLERKMFLELCKQPKTIERIEHMLATGKPLRN